MNVLILELCLNRRNVSLFKQNFETQHNIRLFAIVINSNFEYSYIFLRVFILTIFSSKKKNF